MGRLGEKPDGAALAGLAAEPGVITDPRPCLGCGYSLVGLHSEGTCPECGALIARSLDGDLIRLSSLGHIAMLARGAALAGGAILVLLGGGGAVMVAGFLYTLLEVQHAWAFPVFGGLLALAFVAGALLSLKGWWLLSAPDPSAIGPDRGDLPRTLVRRAVVFCAVLTGVGVGLAVFGDRGGRIYGAAIGLLAWVAHGTIALCYVCWLALRLPDDVLLRRTRRITVAFPVLMSVGWLVLGLGPVLGLSLYFWAIDRLRMDLSEVMKRRESGAGRAAPETVTIPGARTSGH